MKINLTSLETHIISGVAAAATLVTAYYPPFTARASAVQATLDVAIPLVFGLIALAVQIVHAIRKNLWVSAASLAQSAITPAETLSHTLAAIPSELHVIHTVAPLAHAVTVTDTSTPAESLVVPAVAG